MQFQVTDAERLRVEADRIAGILTLKSVHSNQDGSVRVWDEGDFIKHLANIGLIYTSTELVALKAELITRGIIQ